MATASKQRPSGKRRGSSKKRRKVKVIIFIIEILVLLIVLAALWVSLKMSKINSGAKLERDEIEINLMQPDVKEKLDKYTTIAMFGLDNRSNGNLSQGNSDVIIVASINKDTKEVKMLSVYRDTYLNMTDNDGYNKANAAYAYGGPQQAVNMLNVNLDLDITDYVTVDFNAVANAIDLLGGVEIEISNEEAEYMNGYIEEVARVTGKPANYLWGGGVYNLDGVQATSYARVRYTAGDDFKRTERQREVIEKMVNKALKSDLKTINAVIDEIFPLIQTSFSSADLLLLAKDTFSYNLGENGGFPFDKDPGMNMPEATYCVIPLDLASNVEKLHTFLFENEEYTVSDEVQRISDYIVNATGKDRNDAP